MNLKRYKVRRDSVDIETHEVFLDTMAKTKQAEMGISEKRFEVKIKERIIYAIFGIFFVATLVLFSKTFYLQVVEGKHLLVLSQSNKGKVDLIRPERGIIYDKNLKKLVLNAPAYDLVCDKRNIYQSSEESIQKMKNIASVLGKDYAEIESQITNSEDPDIVIAQNLSQENLLVLEAKIGEIPDCQIEKNTDRKYAFGPIFSHILGYRSRISKEELEEAVGYTIDDYIGKDGLERTYESDLRGIPGRMEVIKTALGVRKGNNILSLPIEGNSLVLHIDSNFQKVVYESLEKSIKNIGAKKGAAVALDPRTGAVLALVSYPAYDNNVFNGGVSKIEFDELNNNPNQPFFDRAIASKYPTGSTIKPFLASAALQEKLISPTKIINDEGSITIYSQYDPSVTYKFSGVVPHGLVDMRKAIAVSSNIYFFTIGGGYGDQQGLGPSRIKKYLDLYGWEDKTGIDLPGEFKGFVPGPDWKRQVKNENWWDGDTYNLSIGQSDLQVTPLQVAVAYSAIANKGTLYKPQIVQKIIDTSSGEPKTVQEFKPEVIKNNFINPEYLEVVRQGMRDGVQKSYGSSFMLNDLPVAVAGKTGTAETNRDGFFNTWSSNFAPYDNPEIVFVATIEGVEGLRSATLPVAHDVLQWYFTHK